MQNKSSVIGVVLAVSMLSLIGCNSRSNIVLSEPGAYLIELDGKAKIVLLAKGIKPGVDEGKVEVIPGVAAGFYEVTTKQCGSYKVLSGPAGVASLVDTGVVTDPGCPLDTTALSNSNWKVIHGDPDLVVIKQ